MSKPNPPIKLPKGYTKDMVEVVCDVCGRTELCRWERNTTPGLNRGRPMIHLPDDWSVIYDFEKAEQRAVCPRCHPREAPGHPLIGRE